MVLSVRAYSKSGSSDRHPKIRSNTPPFTQRRAMQDLDVWLEPFLAALGHRKRRTWAPLYLRGLLGPSARKSLQPMAASLGLSGHDQLQHFIASSAWDDGPLW